MRFTKGTPIRLKVYFGPNAKTGDTGWIYKDSEAKHGYVMVAVGELLLHTKVSEIEVLTPQQPASTPDQVTDDQNL